MRKLLVFTAMLAGCVESEDDKPEGSVEWQCTLITTFEDNGVADEVESNLEGYCATADEKDSDMENNCNSQEQQYEDQGYSNVTCDWECEYGESCTES